MNSWQGGRAAVQLVVGAMQLLAVGAAQVVVIATRTVQLVAACGCSNLDSAASGRGWQHS